MKVFRDLVVHGESARLEAMAEEISRSMANGWARDPEAEGNMRSGAVLTHRPVYCFALGKGTRRTPAATVFLLGKDQDSLYVANVVPHEKSELTHDEYNSILEDFYRKFVEPAARNVGVRAELSEPEADLERWLPVEAAEKLRRFCASANKRTGSSHPMDRERWFDFIVSSHDAGASFTSSTLARWLCETGGWDEELSDELATEYDFARNLLDYTSGVRMGR
jgi:hypothetical protein